jgi:catechol 2,3-dioxygenase-like lactoylglutathione lyase family enzyme
MTLELFAGIAVADYPAALAWYERFFGGPPTYVVSETEALWEVTEHGSVVVEFRPDRAGRAFHTLFVADFDARVAAIGERGLRPTKRETYDNGVRKIIYHDPEGNEISYGGAPGEA